MTSAAARVLLLVVVLSVVMVSARLLTANIEKLERGNRGVGGEGGRKLSSDFPTYSTKNGKGSSKNGDFKTIDPSKYKLKKDSSQDFKSDVKDYSKKGDKGDKDSSPYTYDPKNGDKNGRLPFDPKNLPGGLDLSKLDGVGDKVDGSDGGDNQGHEPKLSYDRPNPVLSSDLPSSNAGFVVNSLPLLESGQFPTRHWAGYIPVPYAGHNHYGDVFHWLFEPMGGAAAEAADPKPILVWFNGGPGCSSMDGLFVELGPFKVDPSGAKVNLNKYSWHKYAWTLFIDQPIGTGYSKVNPDCDWCGYVQNMSAVNSHIYSTFQSVMKLYPFLQGKKMFLSGESYAGHYIPSMADYILHLNKKAESHGDFKINLAGLAIGNGWSNPEVQYNFGQFAHNIGLITKQEQDMLELQYRQCRKQVRDGDYSGQKSCSILQWILAASGPCPALLDAMEDDDSGAVQSIESSGKCYGPIVNYYDVRSYYVSVGTSWPPTQEVTSAYLDREDVKIAIHADVDRVWTECSPAGYNLMAADGMGVVNEIVNVLEQKLPMLFYNGQYDFICNHLGTETFLQQLKWSGSDDFNNADGGIWGIPEDESQDDIEIKDRVKLFDVEKKKYNPNYNQTLIPAGYLKATKDGRLQFLTVIGGSHMVPMDVPRAALDMIRRFLKGETLFDAPQPRSEEILNQIMKEAQWEPITFNFSMGGLMILISTVVVATVGSQYMYKRYKTHRGQPLSAILSSSSDRYSYVEIPRSDHDNNIMELEKKSYQAI